MSARSSSPRMKMCATRPQLLGQRTHKVILPNKPNSPSSSRNQNISIRYDDLFSEEPNSSSSSTNQNTSIRFDDLFSEEANSHFCPVPGPVAQSPSTLPHLELAQNGSGPASSFVRR